MLEQLGLSLSLNERIMILNTNEFATRDQEAISQGRIAMMNRNVEVLRAS